MSSTSRSADTHFSSHQQSHIMSAFAALSYSRRTPSAWQRHIDWYSLDSLRYHSRQELPLLVSVSSTTTESDFAVYNCTLTNVASQNTWTVSYRYSEFVDFHTKLNDLWTCHDSNCSGSCQTLRDIVSAYFPKKRLPAMSTAQSTTTGRSSKFELVLTHVLRSVFIPGNAMKCMHTRQNLPDNLFEFLRVENDTDRRSVLQIFVDNYPTTIEEENEASQSASTVISECMICLGNVERGHDNHQRVTEDSDTEGESDEEDNPQVAPDADDSQIVFPSKLSFHRTCIFQWLLFEFHCPGCRANLCPNAFTHYRRAHRSKPQWWLSDFEEDLLHPTSR